MSDLVGNPEDRFSRVAAPQILFLNQRRGRMALDLRINPWSNSLMWIVMADQSVIIENELSLGCTVA